MNRQEPPRDPVADKARELFEQQSERLDMNTALRLRQARRDVLSPRASRPAWLPMGTAAAAALVIGLAWWMPRQPDATANSALTPDMEVDVLANESDSEMYSWLGDAPVAPDEGAL
ncbi:hypothetical protein [Arenimonas sp.]|uniref:hypothetical protein n=1 Tax=Arenimonas sp. TaxID=1872635 RepID=UPI0039E729FD